MVSSKAIRLVRCFYGASAADRPVGLSVQQNCGHLKDSAKDRFCETKKELLRYMQSHGANEWQVGRGSSAPISDFLSDGGAILLDSFREYIFEQSATEDRMDVDGETVEREAGDEWELELTAEDLSVEDDMI